jgi:DNA-directed RNA polymerase specialized sigma24 family protein
VLRYYLDLDVAEIAGTLRISPSAVRSTNTRGLAALARALGED